MAINPMMLAGAGGGSKLDLAFDAGSETGQIFSSQEAPFIVGGASPDFNFNKAIPWLVVGVVALVFLGRK